MEDQPGHRRQHNAGSHREDRDKILDIAGTGPLGKLNRFVGIVKQIGPAFQAESLGQLDLLFLCPAEEIAAPPGNHPHQCGRQAGDPDRQEHPRSQHSGRRLQVQVGVKMQRQGNDKKRGADDGRKQGKPFRPGPVILHGCQSSGFFWVVDLFTKMDAVPSKTGRKLKKLPYSSTSVMKMEGDFVF